MKLVKLVNSFAHQFYLLHLFHLFYQFDQLYQLYQQEAVGRTYKEPLADRIASARGAGTPACDLSHAVLWLLSLILAELRHH